MSSKVSVIIPCYNQGEWIDECLHSVEAQTYDNFNIIIVDDGSTDSVTIALLSRVYSPRVKIIRQNNKGLAEARNTGIRASQGDYILPLDCDDCIAPTFLEKAVEILDSSKSVGIVATKAMYFGDESGDVGLLPYRFPNILLNNRMTCTSMFRRKDWALVGGYNPNMRYGMEDFDFWLSLIESGREVVQIPQFLFFYRRHGVTMSGECNRERLKVMREQLVKNHQKLYDAYPAYRDAFLHGNKTLRHRICRCIVVLISLFMFDSVRKRKLRTWCRDVL